MRIYNTMTQEKEEMLPLKSPRVGIYVCGPTTYNYIHLGNARPLVVFDTLRRYLEYRGYEVTYVQNFTDVDDKIIDRAREEGEDPLKLSARYIEEYFKDADALGVRRADNHPRVTQHMEDIIKAIETLIAKGHAYQAGSDVYFRISSFREYGKLSHRSLEEMQAGARVDINENKEDPMDFALWKGAKEGEPSWDSPWGPGRPGWHIECSVMSTKYLGPTFDIHGGGADLIFPHHENEIAQAEALNGQTFARYWMHNGFITVNKEKMSKSLGNFFIVREVLEKFPPSVVRFFLLATHYRSPLDFDDNRLQEAARALSRLKTSRLLMEEYASGSVDDAELTEDGGQLIAKVEGLKLEFIKAMDDDLNTALALGHLFEICRLANGFMAAHPDKKGPKVAAIKKVREVFEELFALFGIDDCKDQKSTGIGVEMVSLMIEIRSRARREKDFALADRIRDFLGEHGIVLEDVPGGTRFKMQGRLGDEALIDFLLSLRDEFKKRRKFEDADYIRDELKALGIVVEDTREGARWRFDVAVPN